MKVLLTIAAALLAIGCSQAPVRSPTSPSFPLPPRTPSPGPSPDTFLPAMVVDRTGSCIVGAIVEVVRGQRAGASATQLVRCDVWDVGDIVFNHLTPGVEMTLRATAPGYVESEKTLIPTTGEQQVNIFTLFRIQAD
jgi:hypothetical protein